MAKLSAIAILLVFLSISSTTLVSLCQGSLVIDEEKPAPELGKPKQTHLRFYWHENLTGSDPSAITIAGANSNISSATRFGVTNIFQNPLTVDPDTTADVIGEAQGFYSFSSKETIALTILMSMTFKEDKFSGSTLVISGRINTSLKKREIPVIGGSGVFRFATGYCILEEYYLDLATSNNIILYNVYVRHYD